MIALRFRNKRFGQLSKEVPKITDRNLSKELHELETSKLVKTSVFDSVLVVVEYSLTEYGCSLDKVIKEKKFGEQNIVREL